MEWELLGAGVHDVRVIKALSDHCVFSGRFGEVSERSSLGQPSGLEIQQRFGVGGQFGFPVRDSSEGYEHDFGEPHGDHFLTTGS